MIRVNKLGSWLVEVTIGGKTETLSTAHKCFVRQGLDSLMYDRPVFWKDRLGKWEPYIKLLREKKRIVVTNDAISYNEQKGYHSFTRKGMWRSTLWTTFWRMTSSVCISASSTRSPSVPPDSDRSDNIRSQVNE
jgi:hypothetical protein